MKTAVLGVLKGQQHTWNLKKAERHCIQWQRWELLSVIVTCHIIHNVLQVRNCNRQDRQCVMLEKCDGVQHELKLIYKAATATTAIPAIVITVAKRSFKYTEGLYFSESMFHFYRQERSKLIFPCHFLNQASTFLTAKFWGRKICEVL